MRIIKLYVIKVLRFKYTIYNKMFHLELDKIYFNLSLSR